MRVQGHSVFGACARGFLPPPEMGEGWGGGEELGSKHMWPLPPHPCLPPRWGEGADAAVMHGENRELNSPAYVLPLKAKPTIFPNSLVKPEPGYY